MASSSHGVAIMPARTTRGPAISAKAAISREKRLGEVKTCRSSYGRFRHRSSPAPAIRDPPARGTPRSSARRTKQRRNRRVPCATVNRAQKIDIAIALPILVLGVLEGLARENTARWLVAAAVNGVAVAFRRRQPLGALTAVVVAQALAHDSTYDTDPLSPFLAELLLMFTVAYQLRSQARAARLRDRLRLRRARLRLRPHRGGRPGRRADRLLPARVGDRARRARAPRSAARGRRARGRRAPRRRRAPRSPTSARGSPASSTTPSPTACP